MARREIINQRKESRHDENKEEKVQVDIPRKLANLALKEGISFKDTITLLEMRHQIIAHRSAVKKGESDDDFDWQKFYESVKEFL